MMTDIVVVVSDSVDLSALRYPAMVEHGGVQAIITPGATTDLQSPDVVAAVVDTANGPDVQNALAAGRPALLSADSIASLCGWDPARLGEVDVSRDWLPYLPTRRMPDVRAAASFVTDGALGPLWCIDIATYVGEPPTAMLAEDGTVEQDAPLARSALEAVVFGLDIVEQITGASDPAFAGGPGGAPRDDVRPGLAWQVGGVLVTHSVLPAALASAPLFSATVSGEGGRLYLRQPFAPGVIARWDTSLPGFRCPVVRRSKSNIQAPDSVRGGYETVALLNQLLDGDTAADNELARRRFLRLIAASLDALTRPKAPPLKERL